MGVVGSAYKRHKNYWVNLIWMKSSRTKVFLPKIRNLKRKKWSGSLFFQLKLEHFFSLHILHFLYQLGKIPDTLSIFFIVQRNADKKCFVHYLPLFTNRCWDCCFVVTRRRRRFNVQLPSHLLSIDLKCAKKKGFQNSATSFGTRTSP